MGVSGSKLEKALRDNFPEGEHYFGLENLGNTSYCNSVLQALYFCVPFREQLLQYYGKYKNIADAEENLLTCLAELFSQISSQKRKSGVIAPKRFVQRLKKQSALFRSYMHQDAHEFLNYLLNELVDILERDARAEKDDQGTLLPSEKIANGPKSGLANGTKKEPLDTWVHKNFQGILTNETRCLQCETVTARDEMFFDLSLDIEQNSSITSCLKNFSSTETLNAEDKFFCDKCCSLQEAQKRMKIKRPPRVLVIHLKRFKYMEQLGRYKKLSYRVVIPLELRLSDTDEEADIEYSLFAVVGHVGSGPNDGHYVCLVKNHNHWFCFDDENVEVVDEGSVQTFFGSTQDFNNNTDHGYILFYESINRNYVSIATSMDSDSDEDQINPQPFVIEPTHDQPSSSNTQTINSTNSQPSSSNLAIVLTAPSKPTKIPSPPTLFLDSTLLQDVCENIGQELVKLIQARNDLVHKESYEKQWSRLKERVDYIMSALQTSCIDAQDQAQQKLQDWLKGINNSLQEVKILRTWVQNPPCIKGREVTDFIPSGVHPRELDLTFLNNINLKTASPDLALIQRNVVLEKEVKKLQKELLEQKLLMLEYKSSTETKLEEAKEALRKAKIREENLIKSNEAFKLEMKNQQEAMQKKQDETQLMVRQMMKMMNKQANP